MFKFLVYLTAVFLEAGFTYFFVCTLLAYSFYQENTATDLDYYIFSQIAGILVFCTYIIHIAPFYVGILAKPETVFNEHENNYVHHHLLVYFWDINKEHQIERRSLVRLFKINNYLRKFLICIILVYVSDSKVQLWVIMMMQIVHIVYIGIINPYSVEFFDKFYFWMKLINESVILMLYMILLGYVYQEEENYHQKIIDDFSLNRMLRTGDSLVAFLWIFVIIQFIFLCFNMKSYIFPQIQWVAVEIIQFYRKISQRES